MSLTIRIIRPSSREKDSSLLKKIDSLSKAGFEILFDDIPYKEGPKWMANSIEIRTKELNSALLEKESDFVLCARGGYGASDLLSHLDWQSLKLANEKPVIGFSDICSLHSALFSKLGWQGIHAPMPLTSYWGENKGEDIELLFSYLKQTSDEFQIPITCLEASKKSPDLMEKGIDGWLFGGCFSVLTNLIGTPYFPKSLNNAILVLEDVSENPARLMRFLNQWIQAGHLKGVRGIVLGKLLDPEDEDINLLDSLEEEFHLRTGIPVFKTKLFGHLSPNYPIKIGASANINSGNLTWYSLR